jgi:hypothetical protein
VSRSEDITTAIWEELADLPPDGKLLYIWSFTNPHNDMSGLYAIRQKTMEFETGLTPDEVTGALAAVAEAGFAWHIDGVMFVRSRVKRLRQKTPQIATSIARAVAQVAPEHPLRQRFLEIYGGERWLRDAFKAAEIVTVTRPSGEGHENTDSQRESLSLTRASSEAQGTGTGLRTGIEDGGSGGKEQLPADFPAELLPHLRAAYRVLRDLATRRGAKAVAVPSLANTVAARPRKPIVRAAYDCAAHWDGKPSGPSNVVAAYRNWLDKADDLAALESLDDHGRPASIPTGRGTGGGHGLTAAQLIAQDEARRAGTPA